MTFLIELGGIRFLMKGKRRWFNFFHQLIPQNSSGNRASRFDVSLDILELEEKRDNKLSYSLRRRLSDYLRTKFQSASIPHEIETEIEERLSIISCFLHNNEFSKLLALCGNGVDTIAKPHAVLFYNSDMSQCKLFVSKTGSDSVLGLLLFFYFKVAINFQCLPLHAAGISKDGNAYLFLGISGAGKSTVVNMYRELNVIADDIVAVRKVGDKFFAFPGPLSPLYKNIDYKFSNPVPIKYIFLLRRKGKGTWIKPVTSLRAAGETILYHISRFDCSNYYLRKKAFYTATDLFKSTPTFELSFEKDKPFWMRLIN
ncbi:MAG: hypothetical protein QMD71_08570 [bacterium]|nr:hypothetical protein [bacterium]